MRWCWVLLMLLVAVRCDVSTTQQTSTFVVQQPFDYIATSLHYGGLLSNVMVLPQRIARALGRIRESTRNYRLMDDLWFEKLPGNINAGEKQSAALKSSPSNIVELADAVFDTHRLSWHNIVVQGNNLNVYKDRNQQYRLGITWQNDNSNSKSDTRTFGLQRRRMQIMLPIMYKLGVITTLLTGLTVLSLKGVTIGMILLMLAITSIVAKLSSKSPHAHYGPYAQPPVWTGHDLYDRSSQLQAPEKSIHVHVHAAPGTILKSSPGPGYEYGSAAAAHRYNGNDDDGGGGAYGYWNRVNNDYYYDAAGAVNHRQSLFDDIESTTSTNSVYNRWLG